MLYCEKCESVFATEDAKCPDCGKRLREPKENDPVLWIEATPMQSLLIEPLLADAAIPYSKMGRLGAGFVMRGGTLLETYRFYVPYGARQQALELFESAFGEDREMMEALR